MPKYEIGRYEVEITGQGFQKAGTGTMQLVIQFSVLGKIDPNDPNSLLPTFDGERKLYRALTENTVDWVMEDLQSIGVEGLESWAQLDPNAGHAKFIDLTGKKMDLNCGSKNGNDGRAYEDWSIAGKGGAGKPIEHAGKKDVAALDRLFGKHLKKSAAPAARQRSAPSPVAATATAVADDDVPF